MPLVEAPGALVGCFGFEEHRCCAGFSGLFYYCLEELGTETDALTGDVDLVEESLSAAGFKRVAPSDDRVAEGRFTEQPDLPVGVIVQQGSEGAPDVSVVEVMPVDAVELLDQSEHQGEIRCARPADGVRVGACVHGFMVTAVVVTGGPHAVAGVGEGLRRMATVRIAVGPGLSEPDGRIESMFDTVFRGAGDADVVSAIGAAAVAESAAAARRLAAIGELAARWVECDEGSRWVCDGWDCGAAEVAAALGIGHGRASGQMQVAMALRLRLPEVAAVFMAGQVSERVVEAIAWRTALVADAEVMAALDAVIAEVAGGWQGLSRYKLEQAIDALVDRHDPAAVRRTRSAARGREVMIGGRNHESGTAALWGRLFATDAALLERRLDQMARGVCEQDPRTLAQRRADALGALAAGSQVLACQCATPDCPAAGTDARATSVVIHVLADPDALTDHPDPRVSGDGDGDEGPVDGPDGDGGGPGGKGPGGTISGPSAPARPGRAVIVGGGVLPTPLLAALIAAGAAVRHLRAPSGQPEPQYRPSAALAEFVRMRDLTCRFPGCDKPAEHTDIDHRVPWPYGATHPSGLRCLCRLHHLLRTFWTAWTDTQHPDGTIEWTSPSGHTYTTRPGSHLLFPGWNTNTGPTITATPPQASPTRALMMPTRKRTRQAERHYRITRERNLNEPRAADRNRPPPF